MHHPYADAHGLWVYAALALALTAAAGVLSNLIGEVP